MLQKRRAYRLCGIGLLLWAVLSYGAPYLARAIVDGQHFTIKLIVLLFAVLVANGASGILAFKAQAILRKSKEDAPYTLFDRFVILVSIVLCIAAAFKLVMAALGLFGGVVSLMAS